MNFVSICQLTKQMTTRTLYGITLPNVTTKMYLFFSNLFFALTIILCGTNLPRRRLDFVCAVTRTQFVSATLVSLRAVVPVWLTPCFRWCLLLCFAAVNTRKLSCLDSEWRFSSTAYKNVEKMTSYGWWNQKRNIRGVQSVQYPLFHTLCWFSSHNYFIQ